MSKRVGIAFIILGAVLISSALLLFAGNEYEDHRAGKDAEALLEGVMSAVSEYSVNGAGEVGPLYGDTATAIIDGHECIGYLSVPELGLTLPIISEYDSDSLKVAPCRHFGSPVTDDLVIAGHNYRAHFGRLSHLDLGAEIIFTGIDGTSIRYVAVKTDVLTADAVAAVQKSGHDLVLYTCTYDGSSRFAVFCDRIAVDMT